MLVDSYAVPDDPQGTFFKRTGAGHQLRQETGDIINIKAMTSAWCVYAIHVYEAQECHKNS